MTPWIPIGRFPLPLSLSLILSEILNLNTIVSEVKEPGKIEYNLCISVVCITVVNKHHIQ